MLILEGDQSSLIGWCVSLFLGLSAMPCLERVWLRVLTLMLKLACSY